MAQRVNSTSTSPNKGASFSTASFTLCSLSLADANANAIISMIIVAIYHGPGRTPPPPSFWLLALTAKLQLVSEESLFLFLSLESSLFLTMHLTPSYYLICSDYATGMRPDGMVWRIDLWHQKKWFIWPCTLRIVVCMEKSMRIS